MQMQYRVNNFKYPEKCFCSRINIYFSISCLTFLLQVKKVTKNPAAVRK